MSSAVAKTIVVSEKPFLTRFLSISFLARELWEENEELYEAWKEDKLSMQKRLQQ